MIGSGVPTPIYAFFGPPGSGKGTLSKLCVDRLGWVHLSTGNLCRKHIAEGTKIGSEIDFAMKSGTLVSDSMIIEMLVEWLETKGHSVSGIILDGAPRTKIQAQGLLAFLKEHLSAYCLRVVNFIVSDAEVIARLTSRRTCANKDCERIYSIQEKTLAPRVAGVCDACGSPLIQRTDDTESVVISRLNVYKKHANELLSYYKSHGIEIIIIDTSHPVEEVFENFVKTVGQACDFDKK